MEARDNSLFQDDIAHIIHSHLENRIMEKCKSGYETGFRDLDECIGGLLPAALTLIAGRPSMGKTSFVLNIIEMQIFSCKKETGQDKKIGGMAFVDR